VPFSLTSDSVNLLVILFYSNLLSSATFADGEHFFKFLKKFFRSNIFVIGFKQGKLPAMGEKKETVRLEFKESREAGESLHFTYVKHSSIALSRGIQTGLTLLSQFVDICYCLCKSEASA
jgi:hypothetical protein